MLPIPHFLLESHLDDDGHGDDDNDDGRTTDWHYHVIGEVAC